MNETFYKAMLNESPVGFAYHQIVLDETGIPNDYVFIYVNPAFEKMTGLSAARIIGKRASEVLPVFGDMHLWLKAFGEAAQKGMAQEIENYLGRHFKTTVYSTEKNYFITCLSKSPTERAEAELKSNLKRIEKVLEIVKSEKESDKDILQDALEQALVFTQSKIGCIFTYDEHRKKFNFQSWANLVTKEKGVFSGDSADWFDKATIWSQAINQRKPIIMNDLSSGEFRQGIPQSHAPIKRLLLLPVFNDNSIVAIVGVANGETDYSESDILHLELLMNNVWAVVLRKKSEALLREEKELFKTTLLSIGDGILATDQAGNVIVMNEVAQKLTGWTQEEAVGKQFEEVFRLFNRKTQKKSEDPVRKVLETGENVKLDDQTMLISKEGIEHPISDSAAPITSENGEIRGVVLAFRDITVEEQKMSAIEYLSYHDQLTGLYNRRFYEEEVKRLNTKRNLPIAIIMADVNGLKLTNDAFGHHVGDKLLQKAAEVLRKCCRQDDIIARIGGDEFVILLPNTGAEFAERIVQRIRVLCKSIRVKSVGLSISFGWEAKTGNLEEIKDVMKKAEDKMYRNKLCESPSMRGETLQTIIGTLYAIHRNEEEHSQRVAQLCEEIGKELAFDERDLKEIKNAGLLHDIGKIAVDGAILNKEDPLNEQEWQEIRRHPEIGYRILYSVSDLTNIAEVVLEHHERWDGSGYPRNLKGEQISLQARIVALADAYVTMTHERAYCGCLSEEEAIDQIVKNAGSQFDPQLAGLLVTKILKK